MSTQRSRSKSTTAKGAKALRNRLLKDQDYLAQHDEAVEEFKDGKSKALEELEELRGDLKPRSGG